MVILTWARGVFSTGINLKNPEIYKIMSGGLAERRERVILEPEACQSWEEFRPMTIAGIGSDSRPTK